MDKQFAKDALVFKREYLMEKYQLTYHSLMKHYGHLVTGNRWNNEKIRYVKKNAGLGLEELIRRLGKKHENHISETLNTHKVVYRNHNWYNDKHLAQACERFFHER